MYLFINAVCASPTNGFQSETSWEFFEPEDTELSSDNNKSDENQGKIKRIIGYVSDIIKLLQVKIWKLLSGYLKNHGLQF